MTTVESAQAPEISEHAPTPIVCFTYSSRRVGPDTVAASRLSHMAFDAAVALAQSRENEPPVLIASEQTYRGVEFSTGQALQRDYGEYPNIQLIGGGRQLNTVFQAETIGEWAEENPYKHRPKIEVVAWDFHVPRVAQALRWEGLNPTMHTADAHFDAAQTELEDFDARFKARYGFKVGWQAVRAALHDFEQRERYTRPVQSLGKGWLLKAISHHSNTGRYDDISPDGRPVRERTK